MSDSIFERPRPDFMRVDDRGFDTEFKPIAAKVERHLGRLFHQNVFEEGDALSHRYLCNWIGATAVRLIPDTSMRQWSVTIDDQKELADLLWSKAIWTLVHVLPIGFIVARHRFGSQGYAWNPALGPLRDSATATNSNRLFAGFPISQAVMLRLFPEMLESPHAMLTFALIDAFSSKPNTDNPFYNAIRDAIRMTLIRHPYQIPYFWRDFIEAFFAYNPHDLQLFKASMTRLTPSEANRFANPVDDHDKGSDAATEQSVERPVSMPPAEPVITAPVQAMTPDLKASSTPPEKPQMPPLNVTVSPNAEQQFHRESLAELYVSWGRSDTPEKQARSMRDIILYWAKITSEKVQSGKFPVNAPSAFAYIQDDVFITEGGLKRMLALVDDAKIDWQKWMEHAGLIEPVQALVATENKMLEINAWRLRDRVRTFFIPDFDIYTNSDVFRLKSKLTT